MKTTKFRLLLSVIVFIPAIVWAQDPRTDFKKQMNNLFQQVDKSRITSGLLSDYAFEVVEIAPFNGIPSDTNYVNTATWVGLYSSIYDAKINNLITLESPDVVAERFIEATATGNVIPLAMMHYLYDKLDDDALNKGWMTYSNGRIWDVAGKPSPYMKRNLFAVAPQNMIFDGNTVAFVFKSDLFFRNNSQNISRLEINFNNEGGYKTATWNMSLSHTFSSSGEKTITYRITYSDGTSYLSKTKIYISEPQTQLRAGGGEPVPLDKRNGIHSGGELEIRYASDNTSQTLKKPLIIAGPFDMSSILTLTNFSGYDLEKILKEVPDIEKAIDWLSYDIVYLHYNDGLDDIFRNAALFKEAIQWVNKEKAKAPNASPNVVLGISMGGLVARYALRSMEIDVEKGVVGAQGHDTWKYISYDSPHKGANLPLGLQAMIRDIQNFSVAIYGFKVWDPAKIVPILAQLYGVLDAKATRQMLIYYCNRRMQIDNSEHEKFQQEYDRVGFPLKCQNVAVSCGSGSGATLFAPETCLFRFDAEVKFDMLQSFSIGMMSLFASPFMLSIGITAGDANFSTLLQIFLSNTLPGNSSVKINYIVNALPNRRVAKVYDGRIYYRKNILWLIPVTTDLAHNSLSSKADMLPLDGAAGAFVRFDGINSNNESFQQLIGLFKKKEFTLIPTTSSLALSNWKDLVNKDIRDMDLYGDGLTEFESYIVAPYDSYFHCKSPSALGFLAPHLASPPIFFATPSSSFNIAADIALNNPKGTPISWLTEKSRMGLENKTNTSVRVSCSTANTTDVIKARSSVTLEPKQAAALGITTLTVEARKRITAKSNTIGVSGGFAPSDSLTVLKVSNWAVGTPVVWELSDNTNFRKVFEAADSVVIEALAYNKPLTVSSTLKFAGSNISAQKAIRSPELKIKMPKFDCRETPVSFYPLLSPEIQTVEWSLSSSNYLQFVGATNKPVVVVKGISNTLSAYSTLTAKVRTAGQLFTTTQRIEVAIPESFGLKVVQVYKASQPYKVLVRALPNPLNDRNVTYRWRSDKGSIRPCVEYSHRDISEENSYRKLSEEMQANLKKSDYNQLANLPLGDGNQIPVNQLSPPLQSLLAEMVAEMEEEMNETDLVLTRVATVDTNTGMDAVIIGIGTSGPHQETVLSETNTPPGSSTVVTAKDKCILLFNPLREATITVYDEPELAFIPPTDDPSYAVLTYNGGDVTITCDFISPCNKKLTASVFIAGGSFTCTYINDSNIITIINNDTDNDNTDTGGNRCPQPYFNMTQGIWIYPLCPEVTYRVYIYNDYGLVKTAEFSSLEKRVDIPMAGHQPGFYYVNIVDEQGNVITKQTVSVR